MKKIFTFFACTSLLLLLGFVALLPTVLSSQWGKERLAQYLSKKFSLCVRCERLSLSWFQEQKIQKLEVEDPQGTFSFCCPQLTISSSLAKLLIQRTDFGVVHFLQPHLSIDAGKESPPSTRPAPSSTIQESSSSKTSTSQLFPLRLSGKLLIEDATIDLLKGDASAIAFQEVQAELSAEKEKQAILATLRGNTFEAESAQKGVFDITGSLEESSLLSPSASLRAHIVNFPLVGVDKIVATFSPTLEQAIVDALGPTMDIDASLTLSPYAFDAQMSALSSQLSLSLHTECKEGVVSLISPATLSYKLTPTFGDRIMASFPYLNALSLKNTLPLTATLEQFSLPLTENGADLSQAALKAQLQLGALDVEQKDTHVVYSIHQFTGIASSPKLKDSLSWNVEAKLASLASTSTLSVSGEATELLKESFRTSYHVDAKDFSVAALDTLFQTKGKLPLLLGDTLSIAADGVFAWKNTSLTFQARTPQLSIEPVNLMWNSSIKLISPTKVVFLPSSDLLASYHFQRSEPLVLRINSLEIPQGDLYQMQGAGVFSTDSIKLNPQVELKDFGISILVDTLSRIDTLWQEGNMQLSARASLKKDQTLAIAGTFAENSNPAGSFHVQLSFFPAFVIEGNAKDLSLPILDSLISEQSPLSTLLGQTLQLSFKAELEAEKRSLSIDAQSQALNVSGAFLFQENALSLSKPLDLFFTMNPSGYESLKTLLGLKTPYTLSEPTTLQMHTTELHWPAFLSIRQFTNISLVSSLKILSLSLVDKDTHQKSVLRTLDTSVQKEQGQEMLLFTLQAAALGGDKEGEIQASGSLDLLTLTSQIDATIKQLPTSILDMVARCSLQTECPFSSLFGQDVNVQLSAQIKDATGPLSLNLYSPLSRVSLVGQLEKGVLTLNEPLYAQLAVSTPLSAYLLQELNPLSITSFSTNNPITLMVAKEGFSVPLFPFIKQEINIPNLRLELGQITCQNEGNVHVTLGLLKSQDLMKNNQLKLWFAPLDAHVQKGVTSIERTEVLVADTYEIALWGNVDLPDDYVDMILGLTAQCLKRAFGIKNLPPNYALQIPMKGPMNDVKINTGKATAKIALLLAWQQKDLAGAIGGGVGGAIVGGFLNKLGSLPDKDANAPPAKHPFPWEEESSPKKKKTSKRSIQKGDKPLKQLFKILK